MVVYQKSQMPKHNKIGSYPDNYSTKVKVTGRFKGSQPETLTLIPLEFLVFSGAAPRGLSKEQRQAVGIRSFDRLFKDHPQARIDSFWLIMFLVSCHFCFHFRVSEPFPCLARFG